MKRFINPADTSQMVRRYQVADDEFDDVFLEIFKFRGNIA